MAPELKSRGDRPLKMTFEDQLNALVYFHLQEHKSARHLIQDLKENVFAKEHIAPDGDISRSSFSEAINNRGLEQLQFYFEKLYENAQCILPKEHVQLGDLVSIDGSLIDAVLSMYWADYSDYCACPFYSFKKITIFNHFKLNNHHLKSLLTLSHLLFLQKN
jgi:lysyl-tRNA synthetase class II